MLAACFEPASKLGRPKDPELTRVLDSPGRGRGLSLRGEECRAQVARRAPGRQSRDHRHQRSWDDNRPRGAAPTDLAEADLSLHRESTPHEPGSARLLQAHERFRRRHESVPGNGAIPELLRRAKVAPEKRFGLGRKMQAPAKRPPRTTGLGTPVSRVRYGRWHTAKRLR